MDLKNIMNKIIEFRDERDWKQFHDPKNLAEAISIEAGELLELFLWRRVEESGDVLKNKKAKLEDELADILNYAFLFAHETGIDIENAILNKIKKNAEKYPVDKAKGTSKKYKEL